MIKKYYPLPFNVPHLKFKTEASAVVFSKGTKHVVFIEESKTNEGMSLTNSIEFAVIQLSKLLGVHPEVMKVFQLDLYRDAYDLVEFKDGNPSWVPVENSNVMQLVTSWLHLTKDDENQFE